MLYSSPFVVTLFLSSPNSLSLSFESGVILPFSDAICFHPYVSAYVYVFDSLVTYGDNMPYRLPEVFVFAGLFIFVVVGCGQPPTFRVSELAEGFFSRSPAMKTPPNWEHFLLLLPVSSGWRGVEEAQIITCCHVFRRHAHNLIHGYKAGSFEYFIEIKNTRQL